MGLVMLTGATGMIGRRVVEQWTGADELVTVDRIETDLLEPGAFGAKVREIEPTEVLHLAWSAGGTPGYRHSPANRAWFEVTLEAAHTCRELGTRLVVAGTAVDDQPPGDDYSESKQDLRRALAGDVAAGGVSWLRPFYVFDPETGRPELLKELLDAQRSDRPARLRQPLARHDFIHVEDVASAIITLVGAGARGVIDIGSGELRSVADLAAAVGTPWTAEAVGSTDVHSDQAADVAILRTAGWSPTETVRFFGNE